MKKKYILFVLLDIVILTCSFLFFAWLKPGTLTRVIPTYRDPFLGFTVFWLVISLLGAKYQAFISGSISEKVSSVLRNNFIILALITISMFAFHTFSFSRWLVMGTIFAATLAELLLCLISNFLKQRDVEYENGRIRFSPVEIYTEEESSATKEYHFTLPFCRNPENSIRGKLESILSDHNKQLLEFIREHLDVSTIPRKNAAILNTHTLFNISHFEPGSQSFFINLHRLNDFRRINLNFIQVNENLIPGGCFIGHGITLKENYRRIFSSYPIIVSHLIYLLDFAFRRILPKIPFLKAFYFFLTKGENRAISQAEILGRLYFCGFRVIATREIANKFYFIAQKIGQPLTDTSPSYGPLIKIKRVGKDKKLFYIYKLRTMHPYSEYLQQYIYDNFQLDSGGKFKNDFRRTAWGSVFRKLWIDELPQLFNFFRGDVSLVGVRALSEHYFSLYPPEMQELRTQFKPGLVPPYYADMPDTLEEVIESERNYLMKRQQKPFSTQIEYFIKAWWNILLRGARSK